MRVLQINASYKPAYVYGGPTMSVSKLSEQLVHSNHSVRVFTTTANGNHELDVTTNTAVTVDDVPVHYYKRITKDHSHLSPQLLRAVWQQCVHFDLVHIHAWWNLVSILSCFIALLRGVKVVVSPRGTLSNYSFNNKSTLFKRLIHYAMGKPLLKRCAIHVTSAYEELAIRKLIEPKSLFNIPNFVNLPSRQIANSATDSNKLKLIFLSRIEEKKGLDILLNALPKVRVPWQLTIAGNGDAGYIDRLKQLAALNNVAEHITWAGFQSNNKFNLLAAHDLLVLPSHDENFGNVVIESLCVGTAVLISTRVGLADYVSNNKLGWICTPQASAFTEAINNLNGTDFNNIRKIAPGIIYNDFNDAVLIKRYTDMYSQITQQI